MIILLFPNRGFGGSGWWHDFPEQVVRAAQRLGVETRALFRGGSGRCPAWVDAEPVTVEKLYDPRWCYRTIRRLVGDAERFVVHQHTVPIHTWLWPVCKRWGKRCQTVFTDHNPPTPLAGQLAPLKKCLKRRLRKSIYPDWIVPVSEFNASVWRTHFGDQRIQAIPNGIELPLVNPPAPLNRPPSRLLFVGRLMEYKGVRPLLDAVLEARQQRVDCSLEIVGDGPERNYIQAFIQHHKLQDRIHFTGYMADPSAAYERSDIVVIPSTWQEPFGLVSVEAQARYLPCIYSGRGGLTETQVAGETGLMIESVTAESILAAVIGLQADGEVFQQMRIRARSNAEQFSMAEMVDQYIRLYQELLSLALPASGKDLGH